ncbi:MAG: hypothetical protein CL916_05425 [Deltaproteobacteria bacterium]|nr:hypothetical protein [Deltaproteobacteria bacterium]
MKRSFLCSFIIFSILSACTTDKNTDNAKDSGDDLDTGDTGVEPAIPEEFWTEGTDLPERTPQEHESSSYALSGIHPRIDDILVLSSADSNGKSYWEHQPQVALSYSPIQGILTYSYEHFTKRPRSQADSDGYLIEL